MNSRLPHSGNDGLWPHFSRPHYLAVNDAPESNDAAAGWSDEALVDDLPFALYLPDSYEPRFAYPLLIWLHGDGANEHELQRVMPQISNQNYIGVAFRGTSDDGRSAPGAFHWERGEEQLLALAEEIDETLTELRRFLRVNPQRIYLAGFDGGARVALELLLNYPERYSGAAAFGGAIPATQGFARRFRMLSSRRALLGYGRQDRVAAAQHAVRGSRRLERTGLQVETRAYEAGHELTPEMLRDVDHWLMSELASVWR